MVELPLSSHATLLLQLFLLRFLFCFFRLMIIVKVALELIHQAFLHVSVQLIGFAEVGCQHVEVVALLYPDATRSGGCYRDLDA